MLAVAVIITGGCGDGKSSTHAVSYSTLAQESVAPMTNSAVVASLDRPEPGDVRPVWSLLDVQPNSERFGQLYGLESYHGRVTLVVFFAGWCSYCRSQAIALESLWQELKKEGYDIGFVSVHAINANSEEDRNALIYLLDDAGNFTYDSAGDPLFRFTYPIFQDTQKIAAWDLHEGGKDDFFIYDRDGRLLTWLPPISEGGKIDTDLSHEGVRAYFKTLLIDAVDSPLVNLGTTH